MVNALSVVVTRYTVVAFLCLFLVGSCGSWGDKKAAPKPPAAPSSFRVEVTGDGLLAQWSPVLGATHYTLFWGLERDDFRSMVSSEDCALILTGLNKGDIYYMAVTAWNQRGESGYSKEQAILYDDDKSRAGDYLAKALGSMGAGALIDAQAYIEAAIRLAPDNPEGYRHRALLNEKLQNPDQARQDNLTAENIFRTRLLTNGRSGG